MRTTKAITVSMSPGECRRAERLAKDTNRTVSGLVRDGLKRLDSERRAVGHPPEEYTARQHRETDAGVTAGLKDFKKGRYSGSFSGADGAIASMKATLAQRGGSKRANPRSQ